MARRGLRRASMGNLISDLIDVTRDYADDWTDRFDDFEYDMRDAFDDVVDERDYYHDRPYGRGYRRVEGPARDRAAEMSDIFEKAGLNELAEKVEALAKKVDSLSKSKASA